MLGECDLAAGATEVVLTYHLPVYVVVRNDGDGQGAYVTKVVVDDEASFDMHSRKCARNDSGRLLPLGDRAVVEAIALIEPTHPDHPDEEREWPGWEFGW
jgi:hypothetical protein